MNAKTPIIFFGTEDFSAVALEELIKNTFNVVAIITKPDTKRGRGQRLTAPKVKIIAEQHNIPVLQPQKMDEIIDFVAQFDQPAGVLVSFGRIIPQKIIDLFTPGIINLHPSLLPKYRGPSPIESAILNGDKETGISIMLLSAKMDAGPTYHQEAIALSGQETSRELYETTAKIGTRALLEHLPAILSRKMTPNSQNDQDATYCSLLSKDMSEVTPSKMTAIEADRHIRAFKIFPRSRININGASVIVTKAKAAPAESNNTLKMNNNTYLEIEELIAPSGKKMSLADFKRGHK